MAGLVYLTLVGEIQGLISSGCLSQASVGNKRKSRTAIKYSFILFHILSPENEMLTITMSLS